METLMMLIKKPIFQDCEVHNQVLSKRVKLIMCSPAVSL